LNPRRLLLELFDAALHVVDGRASVFRELRHSAHRPAAIFAVGKAASAMARGALDALGGSISQVLVVTKDGHADPELRRDRRVTVLEAGHPVPDERSLLAGAELERRLGALTPDEFPIFLVSGGSSSLLESLHEGVTLGELRALNERGLASGWSIAELNAERARLSRLKAGGVARLLGRRDGHALFISDVPHDDPAVIGSGLLGAAAGGADRITRRVIANVDMAVRAVHDAGCAHGIDVRPRFERFAGEAQDVAGDFVAQLRDCEGDGLVWGGESTMTLPARVGRGGRNQHLALAAAHALRAGDDLTILAAGTDGTDGPTEDAGAIVDAGSIERAELAGVDVERALREFDSGTALETAGDLVHTGPTGTNVGDLLIGIKRPGRRIRDLATPRVV
jgi:glycerate 2-kinase